MTRTTTTLFSFSYNICHSCFYYYNNNNKTKKHKTPNFDSFKPSSCRRLLPRGVRMDSSSIGTTASVSTTTVRKKKKKKDKVVVIMGATGCGKTSLSVDVASRYFTDRSEIINSDKMQVYKGLDITTNKIPVLDRRSVPHHLLGEVSGDGEDGDFLPSDYRYFGGLAVDGIVSRGKLPLVVGGSNSFIYSLLVESFDPETDVFSRSNHSSVSTEFRYDCCFIWVDVELPVLLDYLCMRVDEMLDSGMFDELCKFYDSGRFEPAGRTTGLRKAIGVPEFEQYFRKYGSVNKKDEWDQVRLEAYQGAVREIKENTCRLAKMQIGKILRLSGAGWDLQRVDATAAFREVMSVDETTSSSTERQKKKNKRWVDIWERDILLPSVKIVTHFLQE